MDSLCRDQIRQAGQRYTPGIDPNAPNLRIADLSIAIDNVACGDAARARLQSVLDEFGDAWSRAKHHSQRPTEIERLIHAAGASLPAMMNRLRSRDTTAGDEWADRMSQLDASLMEDVAYWRALTIKIASMSGEAVGDEDASVLEFDFPATRRIPGVRLELPSIQFAWESYHSVHNTFSGFDIPAPSLIQRLCLSCRNREIDFFDPSGRPATLYRQAGEGYFGDKHRLLYVRADLLRRYLKETRQVLVWCNWGERDWLKKTEGHRLIPNEGRHRVFQSHAHIHRTFSQWSAKDCVVL